MIYGIGAIGDSKFFIADQKFIIGGLHTWGWVTLLIGIVELFAGFSLFSGGTFGRAIGVFAAGLNAIVALLEIPAYPLWSLAVFSLCVIVIHQLTKSQEAEGV